MVIKPELTSHRLRTLREWQHLGNCRFNFRFLRLSSRLTHHLPDLRMQVVLFKQFESFFVSTPESKVFDAVLFVLQDFLFKRRHMFFAPVVRTPHDAQFFEHRGALSRPAFRGIKWHNAPSD